MRNRENKIHEIFAQYTEAWIHKNVQPQKFSTAKISRPTVCHGTTGQIATTAVIDEHVKVLQKAKEGWVLTLNA